MPTPSKPVTALSIEAADVLQSFTFTSAVWVGSKQEDDETVYYIASDELDENEEVSTRIVYISEELYSLFNWEAKNSREDGDVVESQYGRKTVKRFLKSL